MPKNAERKLSAKDNIEQKPSLKDEEKILPKAGDRKLSTKDTEKPSLPADRKDSLKDGPGSVPSTPRKLSTKDTEKPSLPADRKDSLKDGPGSVPSTPRKLSTKDAEKPALVGDRKDSIKDGGARKMSSAAEVNLRRTYFRILHYKQFCTHKCTYIF
jgi:hypothetical protein